MQRPVNPNTVPTQTFEGGQLNGLWRQTICEEQIIFGEVVLLPAKGYDRHNHPESEEILYVLSGEGEQMLNDEAPFPIKAGDTIYVRHLSA